MKIKYCTFIFHGSSATLVTSRVNWRRLVFAEGDLGLVPSTSWGPGARAAAPGDGDLCHGIGESI